MHPKLGEWAGVPFYSLGTLLFAASVVCLAVLLPLLRRRGLNPAAAVDLALLCLLGYWLGARALHALLTGDRASLFAAGPSPGTWGGQIAFGALSMMYLWCSRGSFRDGTDALAVAWAFLTVPVKLGCFLAGCCHGTATDLPWGIVFPRNSSCALPDIPVHPTQLYDAGAALLLGALLLVLFLRERQRGCLILWFGLGYSVTKFVSEQFRFDRRLPIRGMLTMQMLAEIVAIVVVIAVLVFPRLWTAVLEAAERRAAARPPLRESAGGPAVFLRELAIAVAAVITAVLLGASFRGWPARAFAAYFAVFAVAQGLLAWRGQLVDDAGARPGVLRLLSRGLVQSLAVFTGLALLRPLFDREGCSLGDALAETRSPASAGRKGLQGRVAG